MKVIFFLIMALLALQACVNTPSSAFTTTCSESACSKTAANSELPEQDPGGVEFEINGLFLIKVGGGLVKIMHQGDILVGRFEKGREVAATTLSSSDLGVDDSTMRAGELINDVFRKPFRASEQADLTDQTLHAIRALKLEAFKAGTPKRVNRGSLSLYAYSESETRHKVYIVDENRLSSVVMLDFFKADRAFVDQAVASISPI